MEYSQIKLMAKDAGMSITDFGKMKMLGVVPISERVVGEKVEEEQKEVCTRVVEARETLRESLQQSIDKVHEAFKGVQDDPIEEDDLHQVVRCQANGCKKVKLCTLETIEADCQTKKVWICEECFTKYQAQQNQ